MIIIDSGPVVAMANRRDQDHERCVDLLTTVSGPLLLAQPLVSEIGYMLSTRAGSRAEADFLRDVAEGVYELVSLTAVDMHRAAALVETYSSLPLGTSDACVIALAERVRAVNIATLDHRHFTVVRPRHIPAFNLLP